jgi:hypothetical protein
MRRAYVAIIDLKLGRLPQRCLVTGEPTGNLVTRRLHVVPSWTWLLLLAGLLPAAVVQAVVGDDVRARLPVAPRVMAERRRRLGIAGGLAGAALMVTVAAAATELPVLLWVSLGLAVGAVGVAVAAKLALPGAGYGIHRQTLWLTRVHPDAAIEIDRWMANWIPPATGDLAQVGWGAPPARRQ